MATGVLQKGDTFADGQVVNAARLNNVVDLGDVLAGLISGKTDTAPVLGDYIIYLKGGTLFKCKFSELPAQVSSVALTMPSQFAAVSGSPVTTSGTLGAAWQPVAVNRVLSGPYSGTTAAPTFRPLVAADITPATVQIAATTIDWSLGNVFFKQLTASTGFSFTNARDGQTIQVLIQQDSVGSRVPGFPLHIWWRQAAHPVVSANPYVVDIFTFTAYTSPTLTIFGKGDMFYTAID